MDCVQFHGEKTASFSVNRERRLSLLGCGKGGCVINFVMEIENLSFVDAVKRLAERVNMQVPEEQFGGQRREKRERILNLNKSAARFFYKTLTQSVKGEAALEYIHRRGITKRTMTNFGLGAAPDAWDDLIKAMGEEGYSKQELLDAGLAVSGKEGRIYDRFRNRVMFPIIDVRGNVIGFGGRVLDNSTPKYLNSPDTD